MPHHNCPGCQQDTGPAEAERAFSLCSSSPSLFRSAFMHRSSLAKASGLWARCSMKRRTICRSTSSSPLSLCPCCSSSPSLSTATGKLSCLRAPQSWMMKLKWGVFGTDSGCGPTPAWFFVQQPVGKSRDARKMGAFI